MIFIYKRKLKYCLFPIPHCYGNISKKIGLKEVSRMLRVLDSSLSPKWTIIKFLELCVMLEIQTNSPKKIYFVSHFYFQAWVWGPQKTESGGLLSNSKALCSVKKSRETLWHCLGIQGAPRTSQTEALPGFYVLISGLYAESNCSTKAISKCLSVS